MVSHLPLFFILGVVCAWCSKHCWQLLFMSCGFWVSVSFINSRKPRELTGQLHIWGAHMRPRARPHTHTGTHAHVPTYRRPSIRVNTGAQARTHASTDPRRNKQVVINVLLSLYFLVGFSLFMCSHCFDINSLSTMF